MSSTRLGAAPKSRATAEPERGRVSPCSNLASASKPAISAAAYAARGGYPGRVPGLMLVGVEPKPPNYPGRFMRTRDPGDDDLLSNLDLSYYVQEVALQCGHARRAWRELQESIAADDVPRAYYHVQALLAATSLIAHVLWPRSSAQEARRGRDLRAALEVSDDSPLKSREMRDHFTHFEQRLDTFLSEPRGTVRHFVDLNMYPDGPSPPPSGRLRHFDPVAMALTLRGDRHDLRPMHAAILELSEQTKRDWWQNIVPPEKLSGESPLRSS